MNILLQILRKIVFHILHKAYKIVWYKIKYYNNVVLPEGWFKFCLFVLNCLPLWKKLPERYFFYFKNMQNFYKNMPTFYRHD